MTTATQKPAPQHRRLSLQTKLLMLVTVVTVAMMSVIVWFDTYSLRKSVEETYVSQLDGMTTAINGRYEESHSIQDVQQIFDYIQYKNQDVLQLTLFGENEIQASTDRSRVGEPSPPNLLSLLENDRTLVEHLDDEDGIPKDRLTAPLKEDGVTIGAIELLIDTSDSNALIRTRVQIIIVVGLAITVLLLLSLSYIIRKLLLRPLLKLRTAAVSVKQGLPYKDISLNSSHEINEVASAFNEMVINLEGRYTELKKAMDIVQHTQKQLVESEKMVALGNLVAGVSHEINTPIGIGVTAVSFMDEKSKEFQAIYASGKMKRSDLDEYLHVIQDTTGMIQTNLFRASELIRSFKQVAVDSSAQAKRRFKLKTYIQEVLVSLQPNLKKTKHLVEVHGSDQIELNTDPGTISQLLTNFIMNSLIHAFADKDEGKIEIHVLEYNGKVTMRYSDNGKGMPPEVAAQIFEPFFTTNRSGGGTGLGMHIVYNLVVQSLGGTITCESELGQGTAFTIEIPNS
ncbi:sensor histidine kinase [Cohnella panacarvi]|uniref:sensor histidine kinase n=1 Tax=Cohnella panacarvi TaxID=400776 RepID=UPI00047D1176|nr:HAMP domain-containing sensor histidine kinase [Cohnella panacarvi]